MRWQTFMATPSQDGTKEDNKEMKKAMKTHMSRKVANNKGGLTAPAIVKDWPELEKFERKFEVDHKHREGLQGQP